MFLKVDTEVESKNSTASSVFAAKLCRLNSHLKLVGGFSLSEKYESVRMIIPNIWKHNPNVPNHQPVKFPIVSNG